MSPAIEVQHLQKSYGAFTAVRDVSFAVEAGEVMCLLGPNGAGKTTTCEILEGYRSRTGGDVRVLGFDPEHHERAMLERIGIVPQEGGAHADLTVGEVLSMYASYWPRPLPVDRVISLVELDAKVGDRVGNLSGGQRRRLDVGLALIGDPELIFLDEPTTGFDPAARRSSWSMVRSLTELGKTVLLTTHFMDEAEALADRIIVMSSGRIVAEGTPATLGGRDRHQAVITAQLPTDVDPSSLPTLNAESVRLVGTRLTIETFDAARSTHELTSWSLATGAELIDLTISRPSLEDIYLELTGSTSYPEVAR
jgi:ABC-2 type transport system ATP-binding protein